MKSSLLHQPCIVIPLFSEISANQRQEGHKEEKLRKREMKESGRKVSEGGEREGWGSYKVVCALAYVEGWITVSTRTIRIVFSWIFPLIHFPLLTPPVSTYTVTEPQKNNIQENKTLDGNNFTLTSQLVGQYLALPEAASAAPHTSESELWEGAEMRAGGEGHPQAFPGLLLSTLTVTPGVEPHIHAPTQLYMKTFIRLGVQKRWGLYQTFYNIRMTQRSVSCAL